jgi:hypothetical protein
LHAYWQVAATHAVAVMFAGGALLQFTPHAPQFAVVRISTSHPSPRFPLQFANPATQVYWHAPSEHPVAVMFAGATAAQSVLHPPQWATSLPVLTSQPLPWLPSQFAKPELHAYWQVLLAQPVAFMFVGALAAQLVPHPPQFDTSVAVLTSQPVSGFVSQSFHPLWQPPIWHALDTQDPPACAYFVVQSFPQ